MMNPILNKKHWLLIGLIALLGGAITALSAVYSSMIWTVILLSCTVVSIIAVREQALVVRHDDPRK